MKKVVFGCLGASVVLILIAIVSVWFLFIRQQPELNSTMTLPPDTVEGESILLVVHTENPHAKPVVLDSIDVPHSFLAGFQVVSITPEPADTMRIPILDQQSWSFGTKVPPGQSLQITFMLKAVQTGRFTGGIDICNPSQDFTTHYADVIVRAAE